MKQAFGPLGSYATNLELAAKAFSEGKVYRAVEYMSPSWLRSGLRGGRYFMENGAYSLDGIPVDTDINAYNKFMQIIGFTPADLSSTYEMRTEAKLFETEVLSRKYLLLDNIYNAGNAGDREGVREYTRSLYKLGRKYPGLVSSNTIAQSRRSKDRINRERLNGWSFNKKLEKQLMREFKLEKLD